MNIKRTLTVLSIALVFVGISLHTTHAQATQAQPQFVPLASYQNAPGFSNTLNNSTSLASYINNVFKIVLSVGGILAVLRIAYAGYMYMGSADMWGNKQHAKEILADAIIGLLLLFGIYLILNQINPNLLNLDILKNINGSGASTNTSTPGNGTPPPLQSTSPDNGSGCLINGQVGTVVNGICRPGSV